MARKNYTPAERALHLIGTLAGKSRQEINDAIAKGDALKMVPDDRKKEIPQGSLDMLRTKYARALTAEANQVGLRGVREGSGLWTDLWDHCVAPKKVGDL